MVLTNGTNGTNGTSSELYEVFHNLSSFITLEFEPVGKWFEQYNFLKHQGDIGFEEIAESSDSSEDEEEFEETPEYKLFLETLDPKNWKDQDHYKVLGLENLRWKATQSQIKKAHKKKVLKYHPDKMKDAGIKERDIFTCITKAFEFLSDPVKRKSYDSVDSVFDETVPSISDSNKKNFYKVFGDAFERNSRWSIRKRMPKFGDDQSTFEEINEFYSFWYDFDSWREFSYMDEESKESASDRDERRWIDKQNKGARAKRKKEETARIRQLVDNAYACDPRILKFKQEEKRRKEEEKLKRKEAIRLREEEQLRKQEEARLEKEKHEEEERQRIEAYKKEKEQQKKLIKKERKSLRTVVKDFNYFAGNEDESTKIKNMEKIEQLIEILSLNEIQSLNESIQKTSEPKKDATQTLVFDMLKMVESKVEEEQRLQQQQQQQQHAANNLAKEEKKEDKYVSSEWCDEEIKLLVKGLKIIPVGTRERWEVIANFIQEHSRGKYKRTGKEVLAKTKEMQKPDNQFKEEVNKKAFEKAVQNKKADLNVQDKPTERYTTPGEQFLAEQGSNLGVWTTEEQKILEQALKTYPASLPDRWDRIAECIPTRSKKDCMVRYKELVELIQAKKKAQQATAGAIKS